MRPIIRKAQIKDMDQLVLLCEAHAVFEQADYNPTNKAERLATHLFADNPELFCLVIEQKNKLIGYASYMKQFSTWDASFYLYMDCLFIDADYRSQGLGEHLVNELKKSAKDLDCTHIQWQTPDFNTRAMKFYDRIGGTHKSKERYYLGI